MVTGSAEDEIYNNELVLDNVCGAEGLFEENIPEDESDYEYDDDDLSNFGYLSD